MFLKHMKLFFFPFKFQHKELYNYNWTGIYESQNVNVIWLNLSKMILKCFKFFPLTDNVV